MRGPGFYSKTVIEPRTNRDHERDALSAAGPNEDFYA